MSSEKFFGIGSIQNRRNQRGEVTYYQLEVFHKGLNDVRTVGDRDYDVAKRKAVAILEKWNDKWSRLQHKENELKQKMSRKEEAELRSVAAEVDQQSLSSLLVDGLSGQSGLDWIGLEDRKQFTFSSLAKYPLVEFGASGEPIAPKIIRTHSAPDLADRRFDPGLTGFDRIWPPSRKNKEQLATQRYEAALAEWRKAERAVKDQQQQAANDFVSATVAFKAERDAFLSVQEEKSKSVEVFRNAYRGKNVDAVVRYCELVLAASKYPDFLDLEFHVGFQADNGLMIVECELPDKDGIPTLQKVTYLASSNELKEKHLSDTEWDRQYDSVLYQIALRSIHELFKADAANVLQLVVFNGWVNALNPATGQRSHGCLLSLQASKVEFEAIDLSKVEPRACFRQLKGVSAARLSGMTPIRPILQLQSNDPRFVPSHDVANTIDEGFNLATMDWEEFEHLVRELFESEFARNGAEVHVTRASSDGGVDAVVLDSDPIHGGKIVVQAKRYTNTVGLSAVRDLYGTVINEGANRGILVSTADYGPDSYEFVKGKPITLLSGSNLLSLLEKHGHKARIDLREAKLVNAINREPLRNSKTTQRP